MNHPLACLLLLLACSASAQPPSPAAGDTLVLAQSGGEISKGEAAAIAQRKHGGKVLNVSRQGSVYRVKLLLDSGRVKIVTVSASR